MNIFRAAALAATVFATLPATAADIRKDGLFVDVRGELVAGDYDKFIRAAAGVNQLALVLLNSPGGSVAEGLAIAEAVRRMELSTGVPNGATCASMCAIVWLAGSERFVASNAHIGFHAASGKNGAVSGVGNAMVGAFLGKLGLSYKAIAFLTSAPPAGISWLNATRAKELGIATHVVPVPTATAR